MEDERNSAKNSLSIQTSDEDEAVKNTKKYQLRQRVKTKANSLITNITVEPVMMFYTCAMMMSRVITQSLIIRKYCLNEMGHTVDTCNNITQNSQLEAAAQELATTFMMYQTMLETLPVALVAAFIGSWSDKNGRKMLLILPSVGGTISMIIMTLNAHYDQQLNVDYILLASVPIALTGHLLCVVSGSISYIADITNQEQRIVRISIVQGSFYVGIPLGSALGGAFFDWLGYIPVFAISGTIYFLTAIYILFIVKETVIPVESNGLKRCLSLFDVNNLKECLKTLRKRRENKGRLHLNLLLFAAAVSFLPVIAELNLRYLYTRLKFQWTTDTFSYYVTAESVTSFLGLLILLPILAKAFKLKDITLGILSTISKICSELIIAFATKGWILFAATVVSVFNEMNSTVTRTMMSKIVSPEEQGKISTVIGAAEAAVPTIGSLIFSNLYNATRLTFPNAIFFLSACIAFMPTVIFGQVT